MKLIIDIPEEEYRKIMKYKNSCFLLDKAVVNGTPLPKDATNGQVLLQIFPPSVYFGDNEKHLVLLAKDCELTCYNNGWWNAPYKADKENK